MNWIVVINLSIFFIFLTLALFSHPLDISWDVIEIVIQLYIPQEPEHEQQYLELKSTLTLLFVHLRPVCFGIHRPNRDQSHTISTAQI